MTARAVVLAAGLAAGCGGPEPDLVVFAAASLGDVAEEAAREHEAETGERVAVSVGATSTLAHQVAHGAPADVVLAADPAWLGWLAERADVRDRRRLARGRLVVVGPRGAPPAATAAEALADARRIALGDPSHVPAGAYARDALRRAGLWTAARPRAIPQADVRAALAAVETGAADAAVVYASDARASARVAVRYTFDAAEAPAVQFEGALVGSDAGRRYLARLAAPTHREAWRAHGFEPAAP